MSSTGRDLSCSGRVKEENNRWQLSLSPSLSEELLEKSPLMALKREGFAT
jgi:hypothetical protein